MAYYDITIWRKERSTYLWKLEILKIELITGEGDRLNLKSKLCQYVSLATILKMDAEIPELELVAYEAEDTERILKFLMQD